MSMAHAMLNHIYTHRLYVLREVPTVTGINLAWYMDANEFYYYPSIET